MNKIVITSIVVLAFFVGLNIILNFSNAVERRDMRAEVVKLRSDLQYMTQSRNYFSDEYQKTRQLMFHTVSNIIRYGSPYENPDPEMISEGIRGWKPALPEDLPENYYNLPYHTTNYLYTY